MFGLRACFTGYKLSLFTTSTCGSAKETFPLPQKNGEQDNLARQ